MLAFRMHQCGHRPCTIIHLQWHLAQSWFSEKGKHDREHLHSSRDLTSLLLSALPMPLLFTPDVYGIDSVCSSSCSIWQLLSPSLLLCLCKTLSFLGQGFLLLGFVPSPQSPQCLHHLRLPGLSSLRPHCLLMEMLTYLTQICNYY